MMRDYRSGDELSINAEFNRIFRKDRSLREWAWKFGCQEKADRIMVALSAPDGERVLVHYGGREIRFKAGDKLVKGGHVMDSFACRERAVVHGRWFEQVREAFLEKHGELGDWSIILGFPGNRALRHGKLTDHFRNEFPLKVWQAPNGAPPPGNHGWKVVDGVSESDAEGLWKRAAASHPLLAVRDSAWLHHRFRTRPMRQGERYVMLSARRRWSFGSPPEAWGVFLVRNDSVLWVDCLWDGRDPESLLALWRKASLLQESGVPLELWEGPDQRLSLALTRWGWTERPWGNGPIFSYRVFPPFTVGELNNLPFYITAGDTDLV
jgi:hypothetical protein